MLDKVKEVEKEFHLNLVELNLNDNSLSGVGGKILGKFVVIAASLGNLPFSFFLCCLLVTYLVHFSQRYFLWRIVLYLPLLEKPWALRWKPTRNFFIRFC